MNIRRHDLKTWPQYYHAVAAGLKTFEVRKDDRGFQVGDVLRLREWNPQTGEFTGVRLERRVTYLLRGRGEGAAAGLAAGWVVMGLGDI